jgi:hypothetical protein
MGVMLGSTLKEENKRRVLVNRMLRRIFGPRRERERARRIGIPQFVFFDK